MVAFEKSGGDDVFRVQCAGEVRTRCRDAEHLQELCFEDVNPGRFPILREPATSVDGEESEAADAAAAGTASSGRARETLCKGVRFEVAPDSGRAMVELWYDGVEPG